MTAAAADRIVSWLVTRLAEVTGVAVTAIDPDVTFREVGLSSRDAVALAGELEDLLGRTLPATIVWENPTIRILARALAEQDADDRLGAPAAADADAADDADADARHLGASGSVPARLGMDGSFLEPIAITGVGCRMPGGSNGPADFWRALRSGRSGVGKVPGARWEPFAAGGGRAAELLAGTTRWGGFLDDVAGFDSEYFGIGPREADLMDPQHRILLEVTWEALEHAGILPESLRGSTTGVFVGMSVSEYAHLTTADLTAIDAWTSIGSALSIAANRISYLLDLRGPSLVIDTACSSSLVAVHQACASLRTGESSVALVGGVNLLLSPILTVNFDVGDVLAADGRCKAFSADADGIVRGEGCGVVILKRLIDARRDGDRILAVIRSSAVNSDGLSNGLVAPNPAAQESLLRTAHAAAGLAGSTNKLDYVEAHGTGTPLGDPIEAAALARVLGRKRRADEPLLLGSVKTNIGHLEAAAGIAGLIKLVLALSNDRIPPSLHFQRLNPQIGLAGPGLRVVTRLTAWPRYAGIARAGVSAFGFGGTNAHVVVEEWPGEPHGWAIGGGLVGNRPEDRLDADADADADVAVVMVSGASADRVALHARELCTWLSSPEGRLAAIADVAATLAHRRTRGTMTAAVVARGRRALLDGLQGLAEGTGPTGVVSGRSRTGGPGTVWMFSGYGSQWPGMGALLYREEPLFAEAIEQIDEDFAPQAGFSLRHLVAHGIRADGIAANQLALFGMQLALARLWQSCGIRPAAVVGQSMGEVAAAVAAGALDLADGVRVAAVRSRLLAEADPEGTGAMALIDMSAAEFRDVSAQYPDVVVAVYAGPTQCTFAGDAEQIRRLIEEAERTGRSAWLLRIPGAGHSPAVEPILARLADTLSGITPRPPRIPFYSTVVDNPRAIPDLDPAYWVANTRRPVRCMQAVRALAQDGFTTVVEIAPHPVAAAAMRASMTAAGVADPLIVPTLHRDMDDVVAFRASLAQLHVHGVAMALDRLVPPGRLVDVPRTPWKRRHHWYCAPGDTPVTRHDAARSVPVDQPGRAAAPGWGPQLHPLLGHHVELPEGERHLWSVEVTPAVLPWLDDHRVFGIPVLPGSAYAELVLAAAAEAFGVEPTGIVIHDLELHQIALADRIALTTSLTFTGPRSATVEVFVRRKSKTDDDPTHRWVRHATARAGLSTAAPNDGSERSPQLVDPRPVDLYRGFAEAGHVYGPAFVGVADAIAGEGGVATARVHLPAAAGPPAGFAIHPALLDACMQTLAAAATTALPAGARNNVLVPAGIGSLWLFGDPHTGGHVQAEITPVGESGAAASGRLRLVGDDGQPRLEVRDLQLRRIERAAVPVAVSDSLFFEVRWEPTDLPAQNAPPPAPRSWLVVAVDPDATGPGRGATGKGESAGRDRLAGEVSGGLVHAGQRVRRVRTDDLSGAIDELVADTERPPAGVVLVIQQDEDVGFSTDAVAAAERTILTVAKAVKALVDVARERAPRLWLITRGAAVVDAGEPGRPSAACLRALVRVLGFEHPELAATVVDIDPADAGPPPRLVAELTADIDDDEIAYRNHRRFVARVGRAERKADPDVPVVRRSGAYLITGGLTGLGLATARWLAASGAGRVLLCGRRAPSPEAEAVLDHLRGAGTDVLVVNGDVAASGVARRLVAAATADGVPLRGVVHAAGVLDDRAVTGLDAESLRRVWTPKVLGACRLHEATAGHDVDWWVVYSSAAAMFGSPGQAAYATANAWMDALVAYRRAQGLPATSMAWGAWAQIGGASNAIRSLVEPLGAGESLDAFGLLLASAEQGTTGITRLDMAGALALFPALAGLPFYDSLLADMPASPDGAQTDRWGGRAALSDMSPQDARSSVSERVRARLATIMELQAHEVEPAVPLTRLGLDSLTAIRVRNAVDADFGVQFPIHLLQQEATVADLEQYIVGELRLLGETGERGSMTFRRSGVIGPRDATERWLVKIWETVISRRPIGVTDDFFALGGTPELAEEIIVAVRGVVGGAPDLATLLARPTVEGMADLLRDRYQQDVGEPVRVLRGGQDRTPLFLFHPAGSSTHVYRPLVSLLPDDQPCYGLDRLEGMSTVEEKAASYLDILTAVQPHGPYLLGGWSLGGALAYETARQLTASGNRVELVVMMDSIQPLPAPVQPEPEFLSERLGRFASYIRKTYGCPLHVPFDRLVDLDDEGQADILISAIRDSGIEISPAILEHQRSSYLDARIAERYQPCPYAGRVVLYRAEDADAVLTALDRRYWRTDRALGWDATCRDLEVRPVPGDHLSIIDRPHVDAIAEHLNRILASDPRA